MVQDEDKIPLTDEGLKELKEEYQELTEIKRPEVVKRLARARDEGDLSENSGYTQAREELNFVDGRISELEEVISRARVIDQNGHKGCQEIGLGCQVTVGVNGEEKIFHLVGEWEADPKSQKISHKSPLGQLLLGKKVGDEFELEAPAGKIVYSITKIN